MTAKPRVMAAVVAAGLVAAGCSGGGNDESSATRAVDQTVTVSMADIAFEPTAITVKAGTTVRFVFRNEGRLVHDAAFGDEATQQAVEERRKKREGVEVGPGASKEYVRTFSKAGPLVIGCHQPGHYQAGMRIRLTVA